MGIRAGLALGMLCVAVSAAGAEDASAAIVTVERGTIVATTEVRRYDAAPISLPFNWDNRFPDHSGRARIELAFPRPQSVPDLAEPYAMLVLRLGNAYRIELNGVQLSAFGALDDHYSPRASKQPVYVSIPANLLRDQNSLVVELRGDHLRRAGMSSVLLGPADLVEPIYERAYAYRVIIPIACSVLSLFVSAFCLLLWLQQREPLYAWAGIGEAIWAVVVVDVVWSPLPIPWREWVVVLLTLRVIWMWSIYLVLEQICGPHPRLERRIVFIVNFSGPFLLLLGALAAKSSAPFVIWRGALIVVLAAVLLRVLFGRREVSARERLPIPIAIIVLILAGVHDALAETRISDIYSDADWAKYAGSLLAITIMWIVSMRFQAARREAIALQETLTARVEARERELRKSFARVAELERTRAVTEERERVLRDMHDGVGSNLATAMRQLESGNASSSELADTLRESLDRLKLSIDAMGLPVGDVNALLASLRYRLQRRIESAGPRLGVAG